LCAGNRSTDRQYYPARPDFKSSPKYSVGIRRDNGPGALANIASTSINVGPGSYHAQGSGMKRYSGWSFPLSNRTDLYGKKADKYQTYDTRQSVGPQFVSSKKTLPQITFGRETREGREKIGMFASSMSQSALKVKLPHPSF